MKTTLFLISGWAYGKDSLEPLAELLDAEFKVQSFSAEELLPSGTLSGMLGSAGPCVVAGWSLGGMLALEASGALQPGSVAVLISSTSRFTIGPDSPHGVPLANVRSMRLGFRRQPLKTLTRFFEQAAQPNHHEFEQRADTIMRGDTENLLDGLRYLAETDLSDTVSGAGLPMLLLHGREDQVISPLASVELSRRLVKSELQILDHVGHDLPLRQPQWVATMIIDFWKSQLAQFRAG